MLRAYLFAQNRMEERTDNLVGTVLKFATDFVSSFLSDKQEELPQEIKRLIEPTELESNINLREVESDFFNEGS